MLTLDAVRDLLALGLTHEQWKKAGWGDVLGGRTPDDRFVHQLRLALAAGSSRGKL
ncbi:MAG: hypothetical protein ACT4P7_11800 [Gemmatimonadaceae bacterium]